MSYLACRGTLPWSFLSLFLFFKSIDKCMRNFLWSTSLDKCKTNFVSWGKVCLSKSEDGLGIRRLQEVNSACFISLGWRALSSSSTWATWFRDRYLRKGLFRSGFLPREAPVYGGGLEPLSLLSIKELFGRWAMANGWTFGMTVGKLIDRPLSSLFLQVEMDFDIMVDSLIVNDLGVFQIIFRRWLLDPVYLRAIPAMLNHFRRCLLVLVLLGHLQYLICLGVHSLTSPS